MKHQLNIILTVVLCICILAVTTFTAMATEPDGDSIASTSSSLVSSEVVGGTSSESGSGDSSSDNESTESTPDDTSSGDTASDENSSDDTSSDDTSSGDVSSSETSSKRPITSQGAGAGDTFIDETTSNIGGVSGSDSSENVEDDMNHFTGETTNSAASILKVIWLPILLIFVCIVGLVYINVFVKPKYEPIVKSETGKAVRRRKK